MRIYQHQMMGFLFCQVLPLTGSKYLCEATEGFVSITLVTVLPCIVY